MGVQVDLFDGPWLGVGNKGILAMVMEVDKVGHVQVGESSEEGDGMTTPVYDFDGLVGCIGEEHDVGVGDE